MLGIGKHFLKRDFLNGVIRVRYCLEAGKRAVKVVHIVLFRDHPRLRGEKGLEEASGKTEGGSPPLARGKVVEAVVQIVTSRITPACAGKSRGLVGIVTSG